MLPNGYDTIIAAGGGALSGGQRQRIGLARAVYNSPKLIILDEPNSNLDDAGETELLEAIQRIKAKGCTVIVISHRAPLLQIMDKLLVLKDGLVATFGTKEQVLGQLLGPALPPKSASGS
jgi:ATP-binding cassette subfamily C protein EexD